MAAAACFDCGSVELVTTRQDASVVCTACGVVQVIGAIDETPEWRTFGGENGDHHGGGGGDPSRVGDPSARHLGTWMRLDGGTHRWTAEQRRLSVLNTRLNAESQREKSGGSSCLAARQALQDFCANSGGGAGVVDLPRNVQTWATEMLDDYAAALAAMQQGRRCRLPAATLASACLHLARCIDAAGRAPSSIAAIAAIGATTTAAAVARAVEHVKGLLLEHKMSKYRPLCYSIATSAPAPSAIRLSCPMRLLLKVAEIPRARYPHVKRVVASIAQEVAQDCPSLRTMQPDSILPVLLYLACILLHIKVTRTSIEKQLDVSSTTFCRVQRDVQTLLTQRPQLMDRLKEAAAAAAAAASAK
jgi:hypothetical protein